MARFAPSMSVCVKRSCAGGLHSSLFPISRIFLLFIAEQVDVDNVYTCDYITGMRKQYPISAENTRKGRHAATLTVREARACFSEVVRQAEHGTEFMVTSHGKPMARISGPAGRRQFAVDWEWLKSMPVIRGKPLSETILRHERDGRS